MTLIEVLKYSDGCKSSQASFNVRLNAVQVCEKVAINEAIWHIPSNSWHAKACISGLEAWKVEALAELASQSGSSDAGAIFGLSDGRSVYWVDVHGAGARPA